MGGAVLVVMWNDTLSHILSLAFGMTSIASSSADICHANARWGHMKCHTILYIDIWYYSIWHPTNICLNVSFSCYILHLWCRNEPNRTNRTPVYQLLTQWERDRDSDNIGIWFVELWFVPAISNMVRPKTQAHVWDT